MTTLLAGLEIDSCVNSDPDAVREQIHRVLRGGAQRVFWIERRARCRIPVRQPVHVTPVVMREDRLYRPRPGQTSVLAHTTDVSLSGIGLVHDEPLPTHHAIVTFELVTDDSPSLLIEIEWTYGGEARPYRSGARFIAVVRSLQSKEPLVISV